MSLIARTLILTLVTAACWTAATHLHAQVISQQNRDDPPAESAIPSPVTESEQADVKRVAQLIVEHTNQFRRDQDLEPVRRETHLDATAQEFANFMARTNKYGHTADGRQPSERAAEQGYEFCIVSENIAYKYRSTGFENAELAERFVRGWENSPDHRENMVDPDVTDIGVGVAQSPETEAYFAVQLFGRPQDKRFTFSLTNESGREIQYTIKSRDSEQEFSLPPRLVRRHERCRPAAIELRAGEASRTIEVAAGETYVIQAVEDDTIRVGRR